jgi:hypothetical protein
MARPKRYTPGVIDIFPWHRGSGFANADVWWSYILSQTETERLDVLVEVALLNQEVCLLLLDHDRALLDLFEFSEETVRLIEMIEAKTLDEFAQAYVLRRSSGG